MLIQSIPAIRIRTNPKIRAIKTVPGLFPKAAGSALLVINTPKNRQKEPSTQKTADFVRMRFLRKERI